MSLFSIKEEEPLLLETVVSAPKLSYALPRHVRVVFCKEKGERTRWPLFCTSKAIAADSLSFSLE